MNSLLSCFEALIDFKLQEWPRKTAIASPFSRSHNAALWSPDAVANIRSLGTHVMSNIALLCAFNLYIGCNGREPFLDDDCLERSENKEMLPFSSATAKLSSFPSAAKMSNEKLLKPVLNGLKQRLISRMKLPVQNSTAYGGISV